MTKFLLVRYNTHIHDPDRVSTTDQNLDTTQVQLGKSVNFIGVTYKSRNDLDSCITKAHPSMVQENSTVWRISFPGGSVGLNLFQAAQLV